MEEQWYVVPELEVRVHQSWVTLIKYCQEFFPYGDIKIQIANALPTKRVKETPNIRFDKPAIPKLTGNWYVIPSTNDRIHEYWVNLIQWCQNYFVKGEIEIKIVAGQPADLITAKQDMRFDRPDTIPPNAPLLVGKA